MNMFHTFIGTVATVVSIAATIPVADAMGSHPSMSASPTMGASMAPSMAPAKPNIAVPQMLNKPTSSMAGRLGNVEGNLGLGNGGKSGNIPGVKQGSIISSGMSKDVGSVIPSTTAGRVSQKAGALKGSQGQAVGRQQGDGASDKQIASVQKGINQLKASQGQAQGREKSAPVSAKEAATVQKAVDQASSSQGRLTGREPKESGVKLSKQQLQQIKDASFKPKVNPSVTSDPPSDDKNGKGGKGQTDRQKDLEKAAHAFDFAKDKGVKPIVFSGDKIVVPRPNPKVGKLSAR